MLSLAAEPALISSTIHRRSEKRASSFAGQARRADKGVATGHPGPAESGSTRRSKWVSRMEERERERERERETAGLSFA